MVLTANDPPATEDPSRRHSLRFWMVVITVPVLLIAGGIITAIAVSFHYLHASALENDGGSYGWLPPDNRHVRFVEVGPYDGMVIPARPRHWQTFAIEVHNPSSVTQTILGLATSGVTAEPERLTVSSTAMRHQGNGLDLQYTAGPVDIPPGATRFVRLTRFAGECGTWGHGNSRSEYYTDLQLRVRVGAFTRTEDVDFGNTVFELRGTGGAC